ncbi:MAG: hypothetical protein ABFR53_03525 [Actinomycetota bacterium]
MSALFTWGAALLMFAFPLVGGEDAMEPTSSEEHCVVTVIDQKVDGELVMSDPDCYPTFSEAISVASKGSTVLAADADGSVLFEDQAIAVAASNFTLGVHFDGYNGTGSSVTVVGSSCSGGYWNATGFYDRINSSYNGCTRLKHYDDWDASDYLTYTYGVGTTDNLSSSTANRTNSVSYHSS